jgi:iron complex transport system ATP-binding protein
MPESVTAASQINFLELENVNVARGERIVLHDINLTIKAGEHVAILGPNGCGKSTLILTINCQIYPLVQPGMKVRIFGRDRWDLTELRKHFGVVGPGFLGHDLPGERTAVTTGLDAVIAGFFSASTLWPNLHVTDEMRSRAAEALERIDATRLANQLVGEMSAGEKRRILIARALVHRPQQLLLDEPSNALDLAAQREPRNHAPPCSGRHRSRPGYASPRRHPPRNQPHHPHKAGPHPRRRPTRRTPHRSSPLRSLQRPHPHRPG